MLNKKKHDENELLIWFVFDGRKLSVLTSVVKGFANEIGRFSLSIRFWSLKHKWRKTFSKL